MFQCQQALNLVERMAAEEKTKDNNNNNQNW